MRLIIFLLVWLVASPLWGATFKTVMKDEAGRMGAAGGVTYFNTKSGVSIFDFSDGTKVLNEVVFSGVSALSGTSISYPYPIKVFSGASLYSSSGSGTTVNFHGPVPPVLFAWFNSAANATGVTPVFHAGTRDFSYPQEWGVKGDNSTDERTTINKMALDLEASSVKRVVWPTGGYLVSNSVYPKTGQTWESAVYKGANLRIASNYSLVVISGQSNVVVKDFWISGSNNGSQTSQRGIYIEDACTDITIDHNYIENIGYNGIVVQQSGAGNQPRNIKITNNTIERGQGNGIFYNGVLGGVISGNVIRNLPGGSEVANGIVIDCYYDNIGRDITITGNAISGVSQTGIYVLPVNGLAITGNAIDEVGSVNFSDNSNYDGNGIYLRNKTPVATTLYPENVTISGNVITRSYRHGVFVNGGRYTNIVGNTISNNGYGNNSGSTPYGYGVYMDYYGGANARSINITGNTFIRDDSNSYQEMAARLYGIYLNFAGNMVYGMRGGGVSIYGINTNPSLNVTVTGNNITQSNDKSGVSLQWVNDGVIDGNGIYNVGAYGIEVLAGVSNVIVGPNNWIHGASSDNVFLTDATMSKHRKIDTGLYDYTSQGGTQKDYAIGSIPDNATITRSWIEVLTQPTSGGAGTFAIGVATNDASGVTPASTLPTMTAGYYDCIPDGTSAKFTTKSTAKRDVVFTIGAADFTAGKIRVWWEYVVSE